ncbi:metallophosphoesterase [Chlamydia trachomatis]|uniref:metallophosphoesterase n=1 Tax=Chlamydia trachomatis TaxID=813 RepID=UPI0009FB6F0F|nr:metallophosphoesterase [Chlamydia trachomatis]
MRIFALADLHLSLGVPEKTMEVFGEPWVGYHQKIEKHWRDIVSSDDIVCLPGDISWAMRLEEAQVDFRFLGALPGIKYMIRGNHDYWSSASSAKLANVLPETLHYLSKGYVLLNAHQAIVGVRLWDSSDICLHWETQHDGPQRVLTEQDDKIFLREYGRLERALKELPASVEDVLVMTHYSPVSNDGTPGRVSNLLEMDGRVSRCLFGHLHKVPRPFPGFGNIRGIEYTLVAADYVDFIPQVVS